MRFVTRGFAVGKYAIGTALVGGVRSGDHQQQRRRGLKKEAAAPAG
jgi:hypothetical protein